ncbi:MAG: hypothetical protein HY399_05795 [Elusimicrobia bacterium]|nr:hypothetical protein [Elusimicrobiota bacterium]
MKSFGKIMVMAAMGFLFAGAVSFAEGPCAEDMKKFCKDVPPGGGRILKCLKEHQAELSQACKEKGKEFKKKFKERMEEVREACQADVKKFCQGIQPGEGRLAGCLKQHEAELSESCRKEGAKIKAKREKIRERLEEFKGVCGPDVEKFCKGVQPGEGRIIRCLKEHESELSESCRKEKRTPGAVGKHKGESCEEEEPCRKDGSKFPASPAGR